MSLSTQLKNLWATASIDLGYTCSGYAFRLANCPSKKTCFPVWYSQEGNLELSKTSTTILLDKDQKLVDFGFDAETKYLELYRNGEHEDCYYFRRFKLLLYNKVKTNVKVVSFPHKVNINYRSSEFSSNDIC